MRIRSIKPEFWTSPDIAALTREERLVYIGLWSYADDAGRGVDDCRLIAAALFPFEAADPSTLILVETTLNKLTSGGQVHRYTVAGRRYLEVVAWRDHQRINRASPSRIPGPTPPQTSLPPLPAAAHAPLTESSVSPHAPLTEDSLPEREQGEEMEVEQGEGTRKRGGRRTLLPADFALDDATRTWATQACPGIDIDRATAKFLENARAKGKQSVDWIADLRMWLLNERPSAPFQPRRHDATASALSLAAAAAQIDARLSAAQAPALPASAGTPPDATEDQWWNPPRASA